MRHQRSDYQRKSVNGHRAIPVPTSIFVSTLPLLVKLTTDEESREILKEMRLKEIAFFEHYVRGSPIIYCTVQSGRASFEFGVAVSVIRYKIYYVHET